MTLPIIVVFISLWFSAWKTARGWLKKGIVLLCMVAPLMAMPVFIRQRLGPMDLRSVPYTIRVGALFNK
jgi:hypothetical protein